jgi:hypothetical protein
LQLEKQKMRIRKRSVKGRKRLRSDWQIRSRVPEERARESVMGKDRLLLLLSSNLPRQLLGEEMQRSRLKMKGQENGEVKKETDGVDTVTQELEKKLEIKEGSKKFRGIPEDVRLFEVFWEQVVQLIKVCCRCRAYLQQIS